MASGSQLARGATTRIAASANGVAASMRAWSGQRAIPAAAYRPVSEGMIRRAAGSGNAVVHRVDLLPTDSAGETDGPGSTGMPAAQGTSTTLVPPLSAEASASVLEQVNRARASMAGINRISLPSGQVLSRPDGSLSINTKPGHTILVRSDGTVASIAAESAVRHPATSRPADPVTAAMTASFSPRRVAFNAAGRVTEANDRDHAMDVYPLPHGGRTVVHALPGRTLLVSTGAKSGYFEDSFTRKGDTFARRTYVSNGQTVTRSYHATQFKGRQFERYLSPVRYSPAYYAWLRKDWKQPFRIPKNWHPKGVGGGVAYYVFSPAPVTVNLWLTNYVFYSDLQDDGVGEDSDAAADAGSADSDSGTAAGDAGSDSGSVGADADAPVTPEVQDAIAAEVQEQLAGEARGAEGPYGVPSASNLPEVLTANRYFIVSNPIEVLTADSVTCVLDSGNVLRLVAPPAGNQSSATLVVASSRVSDCPADTQVTVPLDQVQEMENSFEAKIDDGLHEIYARQGQDGGLAAPEAAQATPQPLYAAPPTIVNVPLLLDNERAQTAQAVADARQFAAAELGWTSSQ